MVKQNEVVVTVNYNYSGFKTAIFIFKQAAFLLFLM